MMTVTHVHEGQTRKALQQFCTTENNGVRVCVCAMDEYKLVPTLLERRGVSVRFAVVALSTKQTHRHIKGCLRYVHST